ERQGSMKKRASKAAKPDAPIYFPDAGTWEAWLEQNHATASGVVILMAKKASGIPTVAYPEVLDTALCYGWIDAIRRPHDDTYFPQRFTPRKAKSIWSKINREKVAALTKAGRMRPAGIAEVDAAKRDGRWDAAYDGQARATLPDDLRAALDKSPKAKS